MALLSRGGGFAAHVIAVFADRKQDDLRDPVLERLRLRLVAAHDQLVEAALGDDYLARIPPHTVTQGDGIPLAGIEVAGHPTGSARRGETEDEAHVVRHEPRLIVDDYHPHGVAEELGQHVPTPLSDEVDQFQAQHVAPTIGLYPIEPELPRSPLIPAVVIGFPLVAAGDIAFRSHRPSERCERLLRGMMCFLSSLLRKPGAVPATAQRREPEDMRLVLRHEPRGVVDGSNRNSVVRS